MLRGSDRWFCTIKLQLYILIYLIWHLPIASFSRQGLPINSPSKAKLYKLYRHSKFGLPDLLLFSDTVNIWVFPTLSVVYFSALLICGSFASISISYFSIDLCGDHEVIGPYEFIICNKHYGGVIFIYMDTLLF